MRKMGLDIGDKTVGIAISDPLDIAANPLETIHYSNASIAWKRVWEIIEKEEISQMIVGLPLNMNGSEGPQAQKVKQFMEGLVAYLKKRGKEIPYLFLDERLSTVAVERVLLDADVSREKRKKVIDKMAASYILQGYLDSVR